MCTCSRVLIVAIACAGLIFGSAMAETQGVTVRIQLQLQPKAANNRDPSKPVLLTGSDTVVVWLTPDPSKAAQDHPQSSGRSYVLTQKDKQFSPHLLVIPTGSTVEFPNLDPFFHNVFSLFNGRRFDLGLYESGTRRAVRFDHAGISYIFCNIHPEMAAVIVSLSTPYYAIAKADGSIVLPKVPPGEYELNLWSQNVSTEDQAAARQHIVIAKDDLRLAAISLQQTMPISREHLNKFGEAYDTPDSSPY